MWSRASSMAPSSGRHSCFSKSDCSWALALSASVMNSRRVRKANLQTSQYAVFGVLPINLTILSLRSGMANIMAGRSRRVKYPGAAAGRVTCGTCSLGQQSIRQESTPGTRQFRYSPLSRPLFRRSFFACYLDRLRPWHGYSGLNLARAQGYCESHRHPGAGKTFLDSTHFFMVNPPA